MVSRQYYGMTLLGNDVLLCGGHGDQGYLSSCDLYNVSINKWAAATTIPPLPVALNSFAMITLQTRPYVFGGVAGRSDTSTVYTLNTSNAWATQTPMKRAVSEHTAVALDTNTALVCGGISESGVQSACFSYAAAEDVWSPAAQMNIARGAHGMAVYKSLFVADYDLCFSGCAQVACLSMAGMTQTDTSYHLLKCCRSTV
jgi:hypothetical protein